MYILVTILLKFVSILQWLIILDALLSWFIPPRSNTFSRVIGIVIDPIVEPFRRLQDRFMSNSMPIDFSPVLAILFLGLVQSFIKMVL